MNVQSLRYPSPRRSPVLRSSRRSYGPARLARHAIPRPHAPARSPFLRRTTRHLKSRGLPREMGRAALALGGLAAWGAVLLLMAD